MQLPSRDSRPFQAEALPRLYAPSGVLARALCPPLSASPTMLEVGSAVPLVVHDANASSSGLFVHLHVDKEYLIGQRRASLAVRADDHRLPFAPGLFDVVVAHLFRAHGAVDDTKLREMIRVLKPDGALISTHVLAGSFFELQDLLVEAAEQEDLPGLRGAVLDGREEPTDVASVTARYESVGFSVEDASSMEWVLDFEDGPAVVQDPFIRHVVLPALVESTRDIIVPPGVLARISRAVDTYYDGRRFQLRVNVGGIRARRG